jgi:hypothetical protein
MSGDLDDDDLMGLLAAAFENDLPTIPDDLSIQARRLIPGGGPGTEYESPGPGSSHEAGRDDAAAGDGAGAADYAGDGAGDSEAGGTGGNGP